MSFGFTEADYDRLIRDYKCPICGSEFNELTWSEYADEPPQVCCTDKQGEGDFACPFADWVYADWVLDLCRRLEALNEKANKRS